ncbi:DUF4118 domain-containing protein [Domibacillus iocasae]|uniref:Uncharacterized protein n=1 Tax=Domibacillus iocasae TaxID=1714016 RepID=A0A1E7DMB4_9BACI|nr:DUF4118 domain-containing protein [Domibacillus iocasae]OES44227.1 hypothetical protein BA724_08010 [Domibacillus iocasae]
MSSVILFFISFLLVSILMPLFPLDLSRKGNIALAASAAFLGAFLLFTEPLFSFWQSALIYLLLASVVSYVVGIYGFPKWTVEGAYLKNKDQNAEPFAEEADLTEKDEQVISEPAVEQNPINEEILVVDEQVYQPVEKSIQPKLDLDEWEPESVRPVEDEPLEVMEKESQKDHLFDEDEYITALYSDEEEWNDSMPEDKIAENGQSDYLAELLREMEEAETQQKDEMDELPLLDLENSKKRTDIE